MGLVDGKERDIEPIHHVAEPWRRHALGRHIKQVQLAAPQLPAHLGGLFGRKRGIKRRRRDPGLAQRLDLVAHQGNQRRDHNAHAMPAERGDLVAGRFARARRKQHHRIAAIGDMAHHFFLLTAETLVAKHIAQHRQGIGAKIKRGGLAQGCCHVMEGLRSGESRRTVLRA
jgi:hypothetical protein